MTDTLKNIIRLFNENGVEIESDGSSSEDIYYAIAQIAEEIDSILYLTVLAGLEGLYQISFPEEYLYENIFKDTKKMENYIDETSNRE